MHSGFAREYRAQAEASSTCICYLTHLLKSLVRKHIARTYKKIILVYNFEDIRKFYTPDITVQQQKSTYKSPHFPTLATFCLTIQVFQNTGQGCMRRCVSQAHSGQSRIIPCKDPLHLLLCLFPFVSD